VDAGTIRSQENEKANAYEAIRKRAGSTNQSQLTCADQKDAVIVSTVV
jgi:hypothetical protein